MGLGVMYMLLLGVLLLQVLLVLKKLLVEVAHERSNCPLAVGGALAVHVRVVAAGLLVRSNGWKWLGMPMLAQVLPELQHLPLEHLNLLQMEHGGLFDGVLDPGEFHLQGLATLLGLVPHLAGMRHYRHHGFDLSLRRRPQTRVLGGIGLGLGELSLAHGDHAVAMRLRVRPHLLDHRGAPGLHSPDGLCGLFHAVGQLLALSG